jgi:multiple RNA-binding domain-containing protein 1
VHVVRDRAGNGKGLAYVQFSDHSHAKKAVHQLDGKSFQGRLLHILEAADRKSQKLDEYGISRLPLKKQKALKRKAEAGASTFNWNSMYLNPDAVLSSVASRLGVSKAELIDPSSSDAAIKQAHAETHVIQETKAFFTSHGINLETFKQRERDDRTLLVKNFPFGTTAEELRSLFGPYGEVAKLLLPPSGTISIIQYVQPGEGIQAMKHLAYRNFKGSVLYLEKAPNGLFEGNGKMEDPTERSGELFRIDKQSEKLEAAQGALSATLFVRNLNFTTTTSGLADAFRPLKGFLSAKVKTKVDPKRPKEVLSMGFGFVEFNGGEHAEAALRAMNGYRLDNHDLVIQVSRKHTDAAEEQRRQDTMKKADAHKTKIIIKNLPFEATKKDVRALLSAYGQLRSVKLPKKFDQSTRGFAFADFVTAKEAESAREALKDTHLLGRRLVLEFAEEENIDPEEEIRAIEDKVGHQTEMVHLNKMTGAARKKFHVGNQDDHQ